ncbi:MAG: hypothetical protein IKM08_08695 [Clostridia bacterium]|nr:hypothetical protein [Clostridia bacterium]
MRDYLSKQAPTCFLFPIDGDCLNERDGVLADNGLTVTVKVGAAPGCHVTVNGTPAAENKGIYCAEVMLREGENTLVAENSTDGTKAEIKAFFSTRWTGKFRISSDDNILFLANITAHKDEYTSIFDDPYLAVYKKAHDLYGAKVHLNLFYAFDRTAAACFKSERPDFDLSMVTDKFKDEWRANADWLQLAFHARTEFPGAPYRNGDAATVTADYEAIRREVIRFAGEKAFSDDVTTIHFGAANEEVLQALRALGIKGLAGYFEIDRHGNPLVAYHTASPLTEYVGERDFWKDTDLDITFGRIDLVLNLRSFDERMAELHKILEHPHRSGFVSLMIHEQYFYADYHNYLPDFEARVLEPARLLWERGYKGALLKEILPGNN